MKKMFFAILLLVMGILFSSTAFAHDGEAHAQEVYEEGSGGSSMDMGHKAGATLMNIKANMPVERNTLKNIMKRSTANTNMKNRECRKKVVV